jgi:hypothetical protein
MSDPTTAQPKVKFTWFIGIAAGFLIFVAIGTYSSRMTRDYPDYDEQQAQARVATLEKLRQDAHALLNPVNPNDPKGPPTAEWVDQDKGIVRIPIEEAMTKEVDTLKGKPAATGAEILGAVPPPPAAAKTESGPTSPAASPPTVNPPVISTGAGATPVVQPPAKNKP